MEKVKKVFKCGLPFGVVLMVGIMAISQIAYRKVYFFNGFPITSILWIISLLCIIAGTFFLSASPKENPAIKPWTLFVFPAVIIILHLFVPEFPFYIDVAMCICWAVLFGLTLFHGAKSNSALLKKPVTIITFIVGIALMVGCLCLNISSSELIGYRYRCTLVNSSDRNTEDADLSLEFDKENVEIRYNVYTFNTVFARKTLNESRSISSTYPYEYKDRTLIINENLYGTAIKEDKGRTLSILVGLMKYPEADLLAVVMSQLGNADFSMQYGDAVTYWDEIYNLIHG